MNRQQIQVDHGLRLGRLWNPERHLPWTHWKLMETCSAVYLMWQVVYHVRLSTLIATKMSCSMKGRTNILENNHVHTWLLNISQQG